MKIPTLDSLIPLFFLLLLAFIVFIGGLLFSKIFKTSVDSALQKSPYECGETPAPLPWINFNIRFYIVGLVFLLFDLETIFLFPVALAYKKALVLFGPIVFFEILLFVAILFMGLFYCYQHGDLDWLKKKVEK